MSIKIDRLDHVVLTVVNLDTTCDFYRRVLGMEVVGFGIGKTALHFGQQKINLHQQGREFEPKAEKPMPGSADLCLISSTPLAEVVKHLKDENIAILDGPVKRTGALGSIESVYFRDPDGNLIEISTYQRDSV